MQCQWLKILVTQQTLEKRALRICLTHQNCTSNLVPNVRLLCFVQSSILNLRTTKTESYQPSRDFKNLREFERNLVDQRQLEHMVQIQCRFHHPVLREFLEPLDQFHLQFTALLHSGGPSYRRGFSFGVDKIITSNICHMTSFQILSQELKCRLRYQLA